MAGNSATTSQNEPLISTPESPVGYVMVLLAAVTGLIHVVAITNAIQFSQTLAILFALNALGFFGIIAVYFTRFWRPELYVATALYSLATIIALFLFPEVNFSIEEFYRGGSINPIVVVSKAVEAGIVVCAFYLYAQED
ncbi:MAG: hypothetical protein U5J64_04850 [Halobacteriales archaeon]|nr:hypothetical protein [Halobacteriales archaeon]